MVPPSLERFEDGEEFLVVSVVVEFGAGEGAGMEGDGVEFTGLSGDGENSSDGIVGGVSFDGDLSIGFPVMKYWSRGEGLLQSVEGLAGVVREVPRNRLVG